MQIKADYFHIGSIKLSSKYPVKNLLAELDNMPDNHITFHEFHDLFLRQILPDSRTEHSYCLFVLVKLLMEPESISLDKANFTNLNKISKTSMKIYIYLQTFKNNMEKKSIKTAWNNHVNLNESIHPSKVNTPSVHNISNTFTHSNTLANDLTNPAFAKSIGKIFNIADHVELKELMVKSTMFELSYSQYHQTFNLNNKSIVIENSEKQNLIIAECQNCSIYIKDTFRLVYIYKCKNCEIFISGVETVTLIENSIDMIITLITTALMLSNVTDSDINVYSIFEPFLFGEIIGLTLGPFNANFKSIWSSIDVCNIPIESEYLSNFAYPLCFYKAQKELNITSNTFNIQAPDKFIKMVLPNIFGSLEFKDLKADKRFLSYSNGLEKYFSDIEEEGTTLPLLAPYNYTETYIKRLLKHKTLRDMIKTKKLDKEDEVAYLNAIQGHFREWVLSKPQSNHLLRLISTIK